MELILLSLHSWLQWLVLISLIYALYRTYRGWLKGSEFSVCEDRVRHNTAIIAHLQLIADI